MEEASAGTVIAGRYRIVASLGGGAMGTVWRAERVDGGGDVAIKLLSSELLDRPEFVERFTREAKLALGVDHPNVCRVFDHGPSADGRHFLVTELLEGTSLAEYLEAEPPPTAATFVGLVLGVLDGLGVVHDRGVVHRDLKPDNIFVTTTGDAKLIDFGVSKGGEAAQKLTATGEVLGTPVFMAPEQADSAKSVMPAADIYGVGAILYDGLAGRPPFEMSSLAMLLLAVAFEDPAALEEERPGVPSELATIVHESMSKAPGDRPPSAAALGDSLRAILDAHGPALRQLALTRRDAVAPESATKPVDPAALSEAPSAVASGRGSHGPAALAFAVSLAVIAAFVAYALL